MQPVRFKNLRKGDTVKILSGKDKGKSGKILEVRDSGRVTVEGINLVKDHRRPRQNNQKGQTVSKPATLDISNVQLVCSNCGKTTRVAYKLADSGEKTRICKHCGRTA